MNARRCPPLNADDRSNERLSSTRSGGRSPASPGGTATLRARIRSPTSHFGSGAVYALRSERPCEPVQTHQPHPRCGCRVAPAANQRTERRRGRGLRVSPSSARAAFGLRPVALDRVLTARRGRRTRTGPGDRADASAAAGAALVLSVASAPLAPCGVSAAGGRRVLYCRAARGSVRGAYGR